MDNSIFPDIPQKQCRACLEWLPATPQYFYTAVRGLYGLRGTCKRCQNAGKHPVVQPVKDGYKHCTKCREEFPATLDYFSKHTLLGLQPRCKKCRSETRKTDYILHREMMKAKSQEYREKNREAIKAREHARWPAKRDRQYASNRNRHMLQKGIRGRYTLADIQAQYARQKGKCYYCSKKITWGNHHIDHTFPISRVVGTDIPANGIDYLVIACPTCNCSKGNKFPWEFFEGGRLL